MSISRRSFIRTLGGTGVVLAAGAGGLTQCDKMPAEAVSAWQGPGAVLTDARERMLSWAILAPNPHNMQPWVADLRTPGVITLTCDQARLLPETDPFGRQIMIGLGAFLELLQMAAAEEGYRADVGYFPDGAYPDGKVGGKPFARVTLTKETGTARDPLFGQIQSRRSNRSPYAADRPVESAHASAMSAMFDATGRGKGSVTIRTDAAPVDRLRKIAIDAMLIELQTPRTHKESIDRLRVGANEIAGHRDGISLHGPMFWWMKTLGVMTPEKAMTPGTMAYQGGLDFALGWANATPSFGWLTTPANDRAAQLNAGRDYVRLHLKATELGVALHPVSQVLQEYPEMAKLQKTFLAETATPAGSTVQMLFRLGYADASAPSPRRALKDIIQKA